MLHRFGLVPTKKEVNFESIKEILLFRKNVMVNEANTSKTLGVSNILVALSSWSLLALEQHFFYGYKYRPRLGQL